MASTAFATRQLARTALRAAPRRTITSIASRQAVRPATGSAGRRFYSSSSPDTPPPPPPNSDGSSSWIWITGLLAAVAGGGGYYYAKQNGLLGSTTEKEKEAFVPTQADYQAVYDEIARRLDEDEEYDDGSYGPVVLRLAWHASGTFDKVTGTGGSNGATMRFAPESEHGANAGLLKARAFLEPVKEKFPWITYSDLWILAGGCAIQEMYGPTIPFRPGRSDKDVAACTPDGRLPDASQGQKHLRDIFYRMGFNDQEIVALTGAHALGRCHRDRSGFDGPWTFSPTVLTNDFFNLLLNEKWQWKKWDGPKQYEDKKTKSLMMLPTDMALVQDKGLKQWVEKYARDNELFFKDFQAVITKLFELGVPFAEGTEKQRMVFKRTQE